MENVNSCGPEQLRECVIGKHKERDVNITKVGTALM
jgi:hypothetical protein